MRELKTVAGYEHDQALWLTLAAENAAALHWPKGVPPVIADLIKDMREKAEAFVYAAEFAAALLLQHDVDGVTGELIEVTVHQTDDGDDEGDEDDNEDDEEVKPWQ